MDDPPFWFTPYVAVSGEGMRFGLMSCTRCGAAIIVGPEDNAAVHIAWHDAHDPATSSPTGDTPGPVVDEETGDE